MWSLSAIRGYDQVCDKSYSDVHVYSSTENEFVAIHSLNPLYSDPGSDALTLDDINDTVIREQIEHLCAGIYDTSNAHSTVTVKTKKAGGSTDKPEYTVENPKAKIVLVIPEDEGLKARIEEIVKSAKTRGVTVEVLAQYGNGARTTTVSPKTEVEK